MSIPRRLGRLARGFASNIGGEDRIKDTLRIGRERGETLKDAFEAAWRGATEEWRGAEERARKERIREERDWEERSHRWRTSAPRYRPRKYPPEVLTAYHRLGLLPEAGLEEVRKKRRELVKRYHPDRFTVSQQRARAEKLTAEINAAHDLIERYLRLQG